MVKAKRFWSSDQGSVESALVLIPTLLLFLGVLQICISVFAQTIVENRVQGSTAMLAIHSAHSDFLESTNNNSGEEIIRQPLPGGGFVITNRYQTRIPSVSPFFILHPQVSGTGVAVAEIDQ